MSLCRLCWPTQSFIVKRRCKVVCESTIHIYGTFSSVSVTENETEGVPSETAMLSQCDSVAARCCPCRCQPFQQTVGTAFVRHPPGIHGRAKCLTSNKEMYVVSERLPHKMPYLRALACLQGCMRKCIYIYTYLFISSVSHHVTAGPENLSLPFGTRLWGWCS